MIRNIIWDVDGTLFDTYPAIAGAFQAALRDLGFEAPFDQIIALAAISLTHCVSALAGEYHLPENEIGERFTAHYGRVRPEEQPPFPGVRPILAYIRSLGGKNVIVTHRGRQSLSELLAVHGMAAYFAGDVTRDDGHPRKPDPAAFAAALRAYGLDHAETISVGDREIDMLAGKTAGVFSCLFGPGTPGTAADLTASSFDELYGYLKAINQRGV